MLFYFKNRKRSQAHTPEETHLIIEFKNKLQQAFLEHPSKLTSVQSRPAASLLIKNDSVLSQTKISRKVTYRLTK